MKLNWKDLLERAFWTFIEGFLVALPATFTIGMDGATWKAALLSAAMAGLSAVKTVVVDYIKQRKAAKSTPEEIVI